MYVECRSARIWAEYRRRETTYLRFSTHPTSRTTFLPLAPSLQRALHFPICIVYRDFAQPCSNPRIPSLSFFSLPLAELAAATSRLQILHTMASEWLAAGGIDSKVGQATGLSTPGQLVHHDPAARTMSASTVTPFSIGLSTFDRAAATCSSAAR